jgi:hypothetical protein
MKSRCNQFRSNAKYAQIIWGELPKAMLGSLKKLTVEHGLLVESGDLQLIAGRWYITHSGLLRIATRRRCQGIRTALQHPQFDTGTRWVFRATVYKSRFSRGFVGYGDADPSNVSPEMRGAEMRIAETRAVNRALRKAYGIGLCSVEELGWSPKPLERTDSHSKQSNSNANDHSNGQPRLRDQLCLLIRQYNLDPRLVKSYAAHFCGTETLKDASRDLVESFISHLAASAKEDRDGLICKLNSFALVAEVQQ